MQNILETLEMLMEENLKTLTLLPSGRLAKTSVVSENGRDSMENKVDSSMEQSGLSQKSDLVFLSGKMLKEHSPQIVAKTLRQYCKRSMTLGAIDLNGNCLIRDGFYPKIESECTLSDILQREVRGGEGVFPIGEDRSICSKKNREVYDCARTLVKRYRKSSTVGSFVKHKDGRIRYLTENEAERLQGFPDDWTKYGNYDGAVKEILSTHRYDLAGNAVTVKVVEEIAKRLNL